MRLEFGWLNSGMQNKAREGFLLFFQVFPFCFSSVTLSLGGNQKEEAMSQHGP